MEFNINSKEIQAFYGDSYRSRKKCLLWPSYLDNIFELPKYKYRTKA